MQKVVVCGHTQNTQAVLETLIKSPVALDVAVYEPDPQVIDLAGLSALQQLTVNNFQRGTLKTLAASEVLVLTDFAAPSAPDFVAVSLARMRKVINEAMANGFAGKILVAMHQDAVFTYFAQRFSGLAKSSVLGLGTLGLTRCFERALALGLAVPLENVTAYAVGTQRDFVLIWSRAYVATTPVLSLMKGESGQAPQLLSDCLNACEAFAKADSALTWPVLVERALAALGGQALLAPLTVLAENNDQPLAYSRPVQTDARGVSTLAPVSGSEAEEAELKAVLAPIAKASTQLKQERTASMKPNYQYPLDLDWSQEEMIQVTTFYSLVEDAYEKSVDRNNLLAAYNGFKRVVPDKGTERQLGREFEEASGYSLYTVVQLAKKGSAQRIKVRLA